MIVILKVTILPFSKLSQKSLKNLATATIYWFLVYVFLVHFKNFLVDLVNLLDWIEAESDGVMEKP